MRTPENILKQDPAYTGQAMIGGIDCTVGYLKEFRWSWLATQLNTYIVVGTSREHITSQAIADFSKSCFDYAVKNNKGWPRGLQAAIGSIAILQGTDITQDAIAFCEKPTKKHWSAFEVPVLYDLDAQHAIRFVNNPIWGRIYFPYFAKTIDDITGKIG